MRRANRKENGGTEEEYHKLLLPLTLLCSIILIAAPVCAVAAGNGENDRGSLSSIVTNTSPSHLVADFSTNLESGIAPLTIIFTDASQGYPSSWEWDLDGDGVTDSTVPNPVWTYGAPGNYSVRLRVANAVATSETVKDNIIKVIGPSDRSNITAEFTAIPITGPAPLTVVFSDLSNGFVTIWNWDMNNDGITDSYAPNPIWTFDNPGNYTVGLVVSNGKESSQKIKKDFINVTGGQGPVGVEANFSATPLTGPAPLTVVFSDLSTGFVTNWAWDFNNDGKVDSLAPNPIWTYETPGNYSVRLDVGNNKGTTSVLKTGIINVTPGSSQSGLNASFGAYPIEGPVPLTVVFSDLSTGMPSSWAWDLDGDGQVDSGVPNPIWTYEAPGNYSVRLTVANAAERSEFTRPGFINATGGVMGNSLRAQFSASPTSGATPLTVVFSDLSTGNPTSWAWDLDGDGQVDSYAPNPVWRYETEGDYSVRLTIGSRTATNTTLSESFIHVTPPEPWWYTLLSLIPGFGMGRA